MPALNGVLETSLYVDDLDRASRFYEDVFSLTRMMSDDRIRAYGFGERSVLLLFKRGASNTFTQVPSGTLGPHDGNGPLHFAFAIAAEDLVSWEEHLSRHEIKIETRLHWPRGGTSLYFRDPDNNLGELATPGLWSNY